jgi:hypothetical protein
LGNRIARRRLGATGANEREQGEDYRSIHRCTISRESVFARSIGCERWRMESRRPRWILAKDASLRNAERQERDVAYPP